MDARTAWNELLAGEPRLGGFQPTRAASTDIQASPLLERHLTRNARILAERTYLAASRADTPDKANAWLDALLSQRGAGRLMEAHALGELAMRGARFEAFPSIASHRLYRAGRPSQVELDGLFLGTTVYFDVKSLGSAADMGRDFADRLTSSVLPTTRRLLYSGRVDENVAERGSSLGQVERTVRERGSLPSTGASIAEFSIRPSGPGALHCTEHPYHPDRYAQENKFLTISHAHQVPRDAPLMFVFVYSVDTTDLARELFNPDRMQYALARRTFIELIKGEPSLEKASQHCDRVPVDITVRDVAASIGALAFLRLDRNLDALFGVYLNPNASPRHMIGHRLDWMTDHDDTFFDVQEDFDFDNY